MRYITLFGILLVFWNSFETQAQEEAVYEKQVDSATVLNKKFEYYLEDKDTIYNGRWQIRKKPRVIVDSADNQYRSELIRQEYVNNQKQGDLLARKTVFSIEVSDGDLEDYNVQVPVTGMADEIEGSFANDAPVGRWRFNRIKLEKASSVDTLRNVEANFSFADRPSGDFVIRIPVDTLYVSGQFTDKHIMSGEWNFWYKDETGRPYTFVFEDGYLTKIKRGRRTKYEYPKSEQEKVLIDLDEVFLQYVELSSDIGEKELETMNVRFFQLLVEGFNVLKLNPFELKVHIPGGFLLNKPKVAVPYYPLDSVEAEKYRDFDAQLYAIYEPLEELLSKSAFNMERYDDSMIAVLFKEGKLLEKKILESKKTMEVLNLPAAKYLDRSSLLVDYYDLCFGKDSIFYELKEEKHYTYLTFTCDTADSKFDQFQDLIDQYHANYVRIDTLARDLLADLIKEEEVQKLEERIIELSDQMDSIRDEQPRLYDTSLSKKYFENILDYKESLLTRYAERYYDEKIERGEELIDCMEKMKLQLAATDSLNKKEEKVTELFFEEQLNLYTYSEITVNLYEDLYRAYRKKLLPHLVESLTTFDVKSCEDFNKRLKLIGKVQLRLIQLVESEEAKKVNRKIRRRDGVEKILEKLELMDNY